MGKEFYRTNPNNYFNIYYLHEYYPKRYVEHKGVSEEIIKFKQNDSDAIERFSDEMAEALLNGVKEDKDKLKDVVVVVVPSHSKNKWNKAMIKLAEFLSEKYDLENGSKLLKRVKDHEKLAYGEGNRSKESHLDSIIFDNDQGISVDEKNVLLLDDVSTTGNSIYACKNILCDAGAKIVEAVVIGKTTRGTET